MRFSLRHLVVTGPLFTFVCGGIVHAQTPPTESPFLPANSAVSASHAQSAEPYQLSAIGVVADKTFVSIYDAAEKRSRWLAVGGSLGNLHVVSCDIEAEQAVVTIAGETRTLTLPKPAVTTAAGAPVPAAGASPTAASDNPADRVPAPTAAASEEDQAREARMLVTDLLEIGMQQRKAYEEAQRKAAAAQNGEKPAATNAN